MKPYPEYKPTDLDWLPRVPAHWEVKKLKYAVDEISIQTDSKEKEEIYLALENVESWTGRIIYAKEEVIFESNVKKMEKDDVLFGRLRPYLAKVVNTPRSGVCVGEFLVLRPQNKTYVDNKWLQIRLLSKDAIELINSSTYGAKMPRASWNFIGNTEFAIPPLDEQERIVKYLGAKHREIERYIAAKRKLLLRLGELNTATISRAVTRGLILDKALKPSSVEWLGDVPEHWEVKRLKFVVEINPTKSQGAYTTNPQEHCVFLPMETVSADGQILRQQVKPVSEVDSGFTYFEKSDVVVAKITPCFENGKGAFLGSLNSDFGFGTTEFHVLRPKKNILGEFLYFVTASSNFRIIGAENMTGSAGQKRVPTSFVANYPLPLPPLPEQRAIVDYLESQLAIIGEARGRIEREIELARELYQTLVAGVVTGQFDVSIIEVEDDESLIQDELLDRGDELSSGEDEIEDEESLEETGDEATGDQ